jgi:hypothetical protein
VKLIFGAVEKISCWMFITAGIPKGIHYQGTGVYDSARVG